MVAPLGVGEDLNSALKHFPASPGAQLPGSRDAAAPAARQARFVEKGRLVHSPSGGTAVTPRVRRDRQAAKLEKGGVRKAAKEQEMHLNLCQICATRGRRQGRSEMDTALHPGIQGKGKLPALLCSTDLSGPHGLETNIFISAPQVYDGVLQSALAVLASTDTPLAKHSLAAHKERGQGSSEQGSSKANLGNVKSPQVSEIKAEQLSEAHFLLDEYRFCNTCKSH